MRIDLYIRSMMVIYCFCSLPIFLGSQSSIKNGSFEGRPQDARMPDGWFACSKTTTPDILPGFWGVYLSPADGESYLGMITRDDQTFESIGQRLKTPLKKAQCYEFNIDLAHAEAYAGYDDNIRIEVYASKKKCRQDQLLFKSPIITHSLWRTYPITFVSTDDWKYVMVRAVQVDPTANGNILIDQFTNMKPCQRAEKRQPSRTGW